MGELLTPRAWDLTFATCVAEVERRGYTVLRVSNYGVQAHIYFRPAVVVDGLRRNVVSGRDNAELLAAARALPPREA